MWEKDENGNWYFIEKLSIGAIEKMIETLIAKDRNIKTTLNSIPFNRCCF